MTSAICFNSFLTSLCRLSCEIHRSQIKHTCMNTPDSDQQIEQTSQSSENIEIPPIPKQTAGAVAGAAVGSIAGPVGAIVGGVAGALAGKAAKGRRDRPAAGSLRKIVSRTKT